ncbi:flavodoxin [Listeria sp. PSOL-1]|uniref:flavodoxin n=1 Tax=Listeria sp. PSOL-1 TaxID=1844999 RepID=UPI0013D07110|nr:flavodoxin [Listeria sp. PSOL-1]
MTVAKIVYASMTGNTEEISEIIESALEEEGIEVEREECTDIDADFYDDADLCIVATYTYGDGELPDEIVDFYEELAEKDLSGKIYGVVGSGDKEYGDLFCKSADDFAAIFEKIGAENGAATVRIENNAEEEDITLIKNFVKSLAAKI